MLKLTGSRSSKSLAANHCIPRPSMICWTSLFLKTFLYHVSATGFCWKCLLDKCVGHVSRRQFFTINIWDMFFGFFWTAEAKKSQNLITEPQPHHTKPYRKHNHPNTTTKKTRQKHHFHLLWRILSLTHLFRLICSPTYICLYSVFCLPRHGCKLPKIYLPTSTVVICCHRLAWCLRCASRYCFMVEHSVCDLYWSHPGLVVPFVSFASVGLPYSATFRNIVSCWGSQCQPRCLVVQIRKFAIYSRFRYLQKLDDTTVCKAVKCCNTRHRLSCWGTI